jgi:hypothetical protein
MKTWRREESQTEETPGREKIVFVVIVSRK